MAMVEQGDSGAPCRRSLAQRVGGGANGDCVAIESDGMHSASARGIALQYSGFSRELHCDDATFDILECRSMGCVHAMVVVTTTWTLRRFRAGQLPQLAPASRPRRPGAARDRQMWIAR